MTDFPISITHDGVLYFATAKTGTHIGTGTQVAEMEADDASRVWVTADGRVFFD